MSKTKLILVEGIPGSGKTTFAKRIADFYAQHNIDIRLFSEGEYHPADLAWCACIPTASLDELLTPFEGIRGQIDPHMHPEGDNTIIAYTQVRTEDYAFYECMEAYEVYSGRVPPEVFRQQHQQRWRHFSTQAQAEDGLTVFECALLQNHVEELTHFHLADTETIQAHIHALLQPVAALSPLLIYLAQADIRETVDRVARQRVSPHGNWVDQFIHYSESSPYGKVHGIKGLDGAIQCLEERQRMELDLLTTLPARTVILENTDYDWEALWQSLARQLPL